MKTRRICKWQQSKEREKIKQIFLSLYYEVKNNHDDVPAHILDLVPFYLTPWMLEEVMGMYAIERAAE